DGPVNVTAPNPVTNAELTRCLGAALRRPALAPVPRIVLYAALGEYADQIVKDQQVLPRRLLAAGFTFRYPEVHEAVQAALRGY
ncbi:MAG: DUF1731 domain-containing protein, partial [Solirubrobacterales bacterium]|nr:DUF1731 domain-containing protein [Solirubrobacterales bacterium]